MFMKFIADPPTNTLQRLKGMLMVSMCAAFPLENKVDQTALASSSSYFTMDIHA